jgi:hypothetical protein
MASVRKRTLPSGKSVWQVDYRDGGGKRRSRQFEKKVAANDFRTTALSEIRKGIHIADSASITVREGGPLWIALCERNKRERTTIAQYQQHLDLHIYPLLGGERFSRLSTPRIEKFVDEPIGVENDDGTPREPRCWIATGRKVLTSLKSMISEMQRRGLVAQNVALPVKIGSSRANASARSFHQRPS